MAPVTNYTTQAGTRYEVRYRKPDGRSTRKRGFKAKREALAWEAKNITSLGDGTYVSPTARRELFGDLLDSHLKRTAAIKATTVASRQSTARNHVRPKWGEWQIGRITHADIRLWIQEMADDRVGAATIEKAHGMLFAVLKDAARDGKVTGNAAADVRLPRQEDRRHPYLTHTEVAELVRAIDIRYRTVVALLAYSGLRFGEVVALRVESVNIEKRRISVTRSTSEVHGKLIEGTPKNWQIRTVPTVDFLVERLQEATTGRQSGSWLFQAPRGGALRLNSWRKRYFYKAIESINTQRRADAEASHSVFVPFPKVTPHDLRHTAASLAVASGANVKTIQRMLGHKNASMTLDIYADLFDEELDQVAAALSKKASGSGIVEALSEK